MVGIYVHTYISLMKERFMKKLFSRKLFAMLTAVTLVTAALVTSCDSPIEGGKAQKEKGDGFIPYAPPAGMSYIKIKVLDNARTILPTLPAVNTLDYRIVVKKLDDSLIYNSDDEYDPDNDGTGDPIPYAALGTYPIVIPAGPYTAKVTVIAYKPGTTDDIGYGEDLNVSITGTSGATVPITLKPSMTAGVTPGSGTFTYNIGLPPNSDDATGTFSAKLTITPYPSGTAVISDKELTGVTGSDPNNIDTISINSGFYYVIITMTDPGVPAVPDVDPDDPPLVPAIPPALQDRIITNILHIYDNLETTYELPAAPLNSLLHTVTYNGNGGTWGANTTTTQPNIVHGSTLTLPTPPTRSGYTFNGTWVRDTANSATTAWVFGTTKLIGPVTLYAMWTQQQTMTLNFVWADPNDGEPELSPDSTTLSQAAYYGGAALNATIDCSSIAVAGTGYNIVRWMYKGAQIATTATSVVVNSTNPTFADILAPGPHIFTIIVQDTRTHLDPPTNSIPNPNLSNIYNLTYTINVAP
jgi:uncharacterized repeat protein (TIGR02543 family)